MTLDQKVRLVESLFDQLDRETQQFQDKSGLGCVTGCGKCCTHPNIDASPLEFLPWALELYLSGKAEDTWATLQDSSDQTCALLNPFALLNKGHCGSYKHRGLICRLFGYAASKDKYGKLRLATCKIIKEEQTEKYHAVSQAISEGLYVPVFTEYYMQLAQIDYQMGSKIMPINKALKMALAEVLQYYAYRPAPDMGKQIV